MIAVGTCDYKLFNRATGWLARSNAGDIILTGSLELVTYYWPENEVDKMHLLWLPVVRKMEDTFPKILLHCCHKERAHVKSHVTSLTEELDMALRCLAFIVYMVCNLLLLVKNMCEELNHL